MMMMMMMMTNFYGGIGTKCTENQISNTKPTTLSRRYDDDELTTKQAVDDDNNSSHDTNNNTPNSQNKKEQQPKKNTGGTTAGPGTSTTLPKTRQRKPPKDDDGSNADGITNNTNTRAPTGTPPVARLDRHDETRTTTRRTTDGTNKEQGRMTTMGMTETIPSATGTLDRKTSQASPTKCLSRKNQQQQTREA
jgi:hypothetical protein